MAGPKIYRGRFFALAGEQGWIWIGGVEVPIQKILGPLLIEHQKREKPLRGTYFGCMTTAARNCPERIWIVCDHTMNDIVGCQLGEVVASSHHQGAHFLCAGRKHYQTSRESFSIHLHQGMASRGLRSGYSCRCVGKTNIVGSHGVPGVVMPHLLCEA